MRAAVAALLKVNSVASPTGKALIDGLSATDRRATMTLLIDAMRPADWSSMVPGLHGAIILAMASPEAAADLKGYVATVPRAGMEKGMAYLLKQAKLLDGA